MATTIERVEVARDGHWSSRSISILAALAVDAGLVWLLFFRATYNPPVGDAEMFWVRVLAAFGAYAVLQQWTLANQTGRGDDLSSALDKFVAASPIVVALVIEAYWLGAGRRRAILAPSCRGRFVVSIRDYRLLCHGHHEPAAKGPPIQRRGRRRGLGLIDVVSAEERRRRRPPCSRHGSAAVS